MKDSNVTGAKNEKKWLDGQTQSSWIASFRHHEYNTHAFITTITSHTLITRLVVCNCKLLSSGPDG
jgi:hypothetical protein